MRKILTLLLVLVIGKVSAQPALVPAARINPQWINGYWKASWISSPDAAPRDYGVYHFRKSFDLAAQPSSFIVHVSADNRYRLFVNGKPICSGPARGNLYNWYFESVDLAPFLQKGKNVIAAMVWNMGVHAPVAQISNQTAFVLQGDGESEKIVNTDNSWKVIKNDAYTPCSLDNGQRMRSYMVVGPGDHVDASKFPWGWEQSDFDDNNWKKSIWVSGPVAFGYGSDNFWTLVPRNIPLMFEREQRIPVVRRSEGLVVKNDFLKGGSPLNIPANSKVTILLDQTYNTVAYPELIISSGKNAEVKMTYAEALYNKDFVKGNRNDIEGKTVTGNYDIIIGDGEKSRHFRPLWVRTYRYLQLDILTKEQPLVIEDFYGNATGYPFEVKASFTSNDASMKDIWDIGWRTAQLCAGETYFDCPYYEQLQYEGDTRIQSLISLYVTGDDRLMRKALLDFYQSRVPEGLTQGRYPSSRLQVIPPFSLYWVSMIHDYWMHRKDDAFVSGFLQAAAGVLQWYKDHIDKDKGILGPMKWWNFVDWNQAFNGGTPDGADNSNSSIISLQYSYTLRQASELFAYFGRKYESDQYKKLSDSINAATYRICFDQKKGVMANTPDKKTFSQHASIMAILSECIPTAQRKLVMQKILHDTTLSQATFYYRFYLNRALKKLGMSDLYYAELKPWRDMIKIGLTTFAEEPDPTRSDCHAWSSSPNYDFFSIICGINPSSPGFSSVEIAPALGELKEIEGVLPHPSGMIQVKMKRTGLSGINAQVRLPQGLNGNFIWNNKIVKLKPGIQEINL
ncbi:MAG: alpha-L-rhamnosidase N-terminal domain-containing protein [Chitinophagaceae bacterium]